MKRRHFLGATTAAALGSRTQAADSPAAPVRDAGPLFTFAVIADAQYADVEAEGERHYRSTPEKMKQAVETIRAAGPAFTLHLGDLIDRDFKSFDTMLPLLAALGHPVHHLLGNHDYSVAGGEKAGVVAKLGMPHDYYRFSHRGIRFLMLDTNDPSTYKHPADSAESAAAAQQLAALKGPNAQPWNGGVSTSQLQWLEQELTAAEKAGERTILCGHHPLLPADAHQLWNPPEVQAVIDRHPSILAWLNGHNHAGGYEERKGVHYLTFRSLLHQPEITAFAMVRVFPQRLIVEGHGREPSRTLEFRTSAR